MRCDTMREQRMALFPSAVNTEEKLCFPISHILSRRSKAAAQFLKCRTGLRSGSAHLRMLEEETGDRHCSFTKAHLRISRASDMPGTDSIHQFAF
jgi:hypothetical protein